MEIRPVSKTRRAFWFIIGLAAVLAFIAVTALYCAFIVPESQPPCTTPTAVVDQETGDVSGTACPDGAVYRCEPLLRRLKKLF